MNSVFYTPQRQAVKGLFIMYVDTLQEFVRAFWALLLIVFIRSSSESFFIKLGLSFLLMFLFVIAFLKFKNFTFYINQATNEFIIQKGVLSKSKIVIQLSKIQQVSIKQTFVQKLVNVYSLEIDTAGSNKKEAVIRAIDKKLAEELKEILLMYQNENNTIEPDKVLEPLQENKFLKITFFTLIKTGLTSHYQRSIALLLGFFAAIYNGLQDLESVINLDDYAIINYENLSFNFLYFALFIATLFFILLFINLIRTILKHFDYEIISQKNSLIISSGLFAKNSIILNPSRVQITTICQNKIQQKIDLFTIKLKQSSSEEPDKNNKSATIEIPGVNTTEKKSLLSFLFFKNTINKQNGYVPNYRWLIFKFIIFFITIPVLFLGWGYWQNFPYNILFFILLFYILAASYYLYFGYKNYKLFISEDLVIKQSGAWDVELELFENHKIQAITLKQYFWHKKANIGHITFHTAAGDVPFNFCNFTALKKLTNRLLYNIEKENKNWM